MYDSVVDAKVEFDSLYFSAGGRPSAPGQCCGMRLGFGDFWRKGATHRYLEAAKICTFATFDTCQTLHLETCQDFRQAAMWDPAGSCGCMR